MPKGLGVCKRPATVRCGLTLGQLKWIPPRAIPPPAPCQLPRNVTLSLDREPAAPSGPRTKPLILQQSPTGGTAGMRRARVARDGEQRGFLKVGVSSAPAPMQAGHLRNALRAVRRGKR